MGLGRCVVFADEGYREISAFSWAQPSNSRLLSHAQAHGEDLIPF